MCERLSFLKTVTELRIREKERLRYNDDLYLPITMTYTSSIS